MESSLSVDDLDGPRGSTSWWKAIAIAIAMLLTIFVVLILIPNFLLGYLTTRVIPNARDLIVVGVWLVAFVLCCVLFVRLQRRAGG